MEKKNTGKIQACIDFHNLNKATSKDEYPMPIAHMRKVATCDTFVIHVCHVVRLFSLAR
jgi:hypothetical protein